MGPYIAHVWSRHHGVQEDTPALAKADREFLLKRLSLLQKALERLMAGQSANTVSNKTWRLCENALDALEDEE